MKKIIICFNGGESLVIECNTLEMITGTTFITLKYSNEFVYRAEIMLELDNLREFKIYNVEEK